MNKFLSVYRNRWFRFAMVALLYLLFVIWLGNYWFLIGEVIIFDIYISKKVRWAFWKPRRGKDGKREKGKRNATLEWVDAIIFAVVAATVIRMFFIEAYTIPTSSMEKTMMVGDYLFVSKVAYGPKVPNTPVAFPLVHHTLPFTKFTPSFSTIIQNPYRRLKGFGNVQRNDIVVFNFPEGDTVVAQEQNSSYYMLVKRFGREYLWKNYDVLVRPVDKRENYIKRCVGVPGDSIQVIHGQLFVNGVAQEHFPYMQSNYYLRTNGQRINGKLLDDMRIPKQDRQLTYGGTYDMPLTESEFEKMQKLSVVTLAVKRDNVDPSLNPLPLFPDRLAAAWTEDNYGPLWIPKKGATVALDSASLPLYQRVIAVYEGNRLEQRDGKIYVNGEEATSYTFKMNYYWMMGDNRNNSLDSRYWGFVPEDHVVGKASFVWLSLDPDRKFPMNIRWNRVFRFI